MASGRPNAVCASQMPRNVPFSPTSAVQPQDRDECHLEGHDQEADDEGEQETTEWELDPGEGVGSERRDRDGDHGCRDGHDEAVDEGLDEPLAAR